MRSEFLAAIGALVAFVATAGTASATAYTLDGSIGFTAGGATGTVDPVGTAQNADFSVCLAGVCDYTTQDYLVFEVTVTSGSVNDVGVGALFANALGLGYFLNGNPVQDGTGGADTYTGTIANPSVPTFTFLANGGGAGLSGTSLVLFATYASGALPTAGGGPYGPGSTQFMITDYGSAGIDSPVEPVTTPVDVVPEPATALLVGGGLLLLGARARRRSA